MCQKGNTGSKRQRPRLCSNVRTDPRPLGPPPLRPFSSASSVEAKPPFNRPGFRRLVGEDEQQRR